MSGPIYQTRRNRAVANALDVSLQMMPSVLVGVIAEYSRDRDVAALIKMLASRPDQALVIKSQWLGTFAIILHIGSRREYVSLMVCIKVDRYRRVIKMDLDGMVGLLDDQLRLAAIIEKLHVSVGSAIRYEAHFPSMEDIDHIVHSIDDAWAKARKM